MRKSAEQASALCVQICCTLAFALSMFFVFLFKYCLSSRTQLTYSHAKPCLSADRPTLRCMVTASRIDKVDNRSGRLKAYSLKPVILAMSDCARALAELLRVLETRDYLKSKPLLRKCAKSSAAKPFRTSEELPRFLRTLVSFWMPTTFPCGRHRSLLILHAVTPHC